MRGGFIKDKDRRVFQESAGNRKPLAFPSGQFESPFPEGCVISLWKFFNEMIRVRDLSGFFHGFNARIRPAVSDVLPHSTIKKYGFLRNNADSIAQRVKGETLDILPVDRNSTPYRIIASQKEIHKRCLSRTAGSYKGDDFILLCLDIDILQNPVAWFIIKIYMFISHFADIFA